MLYLFQIYKCIVLFKAALFFNFSAEKNHWNFRQSSETDRIWILVHIKMLGWIRIKRIQIRNTALGFLLLRIDNLKCHEVGSWSWICDVFSLVCNVDTSALRKKSDIQLIKYYFLSIYFQSEYLVNNVIAGYFSSTSWYMDIARR